MSRRFRPWTLQDELEREYEHAPANERPLFPPSSSPIFPIRAAGHPSPAGEATETPAVPSPQFRAAGVSVTPSNCQE